SRTSSSHSWLRNSAVTDARRRCESTTMPARPRTDRLRAAPSPPVTGPAGTPPTETRRAAPRQECASSGRWGRPGPGERATPRGVERRNRDVVYAQVVGVRVERPIVAVRHDHLRTFRADDLDEAPNRLVQRSVGEIVGARVRLRVGHPGIVIAEHVKRVVADRIDGVAQLLHPDGRELVTNGRSVDFGVEDVAGLAAGAAH